MARKERVYLGKLDGNGVWLMASIRGTGDEILEDAIIAIPPGTAMLPARTAGVGVLQPGDLAMLDPDPEAWYGLGGRKGIEARMPGLHERAHQHMAYASRRSSKSRGLSSVAVDFALVVFVPAAIVRLFMPWLDSIQAGELLKWSAAALIFSVIAFVYVGGMVDGVRSLAARPRSADIGGVSTVGNRELIGMLKWPVILLNIAFLFLVAVYLPFAWALAAFMLALVAQVVLDIRGEVKAALSRWLDGVRPSGTSSAFSMVWYERDRVAASE